MPAETLRTKRNTKFTTWWEALNAEMAKRGLEQALYGDARGHYEVGHSPETAAQEEAVQRELTREAEADYHAARFMQAERLCTTEERA